MVFFVFDGGEPAQILARVVRKIIPSGTRRIVQTFRALYIRKNQVVLQT